LEVFSPPRQPALEELVVQVDSVLEELPGGLLLRKLPGGEFPLQKLFEFFGASSCHVLALTHLFRGTVPANGGRPPENPEGATFDGGSNRPHIKNRWEFGAVVVVVGVRSPFPPLLDEA